MSVGVAQCDAQTLSLDALIKRADVALFDAKRAGRDRVQAAELPV